MSGHQLTIERRGKVAFTWSCECGERHPDDLAAFWTSQEAAQAWRRHLGQGEKATGGVYTGPPIEFEEPAAFVSRPRQNGKTAISEHINALQARIAELERQRDGARYACEDAIRISATYQTSITGTILAKVVLAWLSDAAPTKPVLLDVSRDSQRHPRDETGRFVPEGETGQFIERGERG